MPISSQENIVRAICSNQYDGDRLSPSLFKGTNTSVSRLSLIPLEEHWALFREHVQKPQHQPLLKKIGEINVGVLQEIGRNYVESPKEITVDPNPLDWNRAHAVIPQNITRGLANKIIHEIKLHTECETNS